MRAVAFVVMLFCAGLAVACNADTKEPASATTANTHAEPTTTALPATSTSSPPTATPEPPTPAPILPTPTLEPPSPTPASSAASCNPNYSGACLNKPGDYDCAGGSGNGPNYIRGPIRVVGEDVYGLDRDGDGIACE